MSSISILPCTAADGPAIGALNVHAFWTDRTWVRLWPGKTRDYVASQAARRGTHMLLSDRRRRRHLKAVDPADDNRIVGYARWEMPLSLPADREEGRDRLGHSLWPQARVPDVSDNDRQRAQEESEAADWEFDRSLDVLDPPMIDMKDEQMRHKHYILLDYLTVHPDYRGRGIAMSLVQAGLRAAEEARLETCVLAMRAALGVYTRAGFRLLQKVVQDASPYGGESEYGAYFLVKEVKDAGEEGRRTED